MPRRHDRGRIDEAARRGIRRSRRRSTAAWFDRLVRGLAHLRHQRPVRRRCRHVVRRVVAEHRDAIERHLGLRGNTSSTSSVRSSRRLPGQADADDVARRMDELRAPFGVSSGRPVNRPQQVDRAASSRSARRSRSTRRRPCQPLRARSTCCDRAVESACVPRGSCAATRAPDRAGAAVQRKAERRVRSPAHVVAALHDVGEDPREIDRRDALAHPADVERDGS